MAGRSDRKKREEEALPASSSVLQPVICSLLCLSWKVCVQCTKVLKTHLHGEIGMRSLACHHGLRTHSLSIQAKRLAEHTPGATATIKFEF